MKSTQTQLNHHTRSSALPLLPLFTYLTYLTLLTLLTLLTSLAFAQPATFNFQPATPPDPGLIQPLIDGPIGTYGWLTTVLLVIGSLRLLFTPLMLLLEHRLNTAP